MYKIFITGIMLFFFLKLETQSLKPTEQFRRHGFTFGVSAGAGYLSVKTNGTASTGLAATIPNFRIGYMIHDRLAVQLLQPGSPYRYQNTDRVYEGFLLSGQYWLLDRLWLQGGVGVTFDAPAFWTLPGLKNPAFNFGLPAFSLATGYEIFRWKNYTLDAYYRFYYGKAELEGGGERTGVSHMLAFGLNLY